MEGTGPEVKRPRHHYDAQQRMSVQQQQQQQHPPHPPPHPPSSASHAQLGILPAPSPYSQPLQQHPLPPSPFHDVNHDSRNLADPHSYVQQHPHSGQTPRDGRFQPESDFSRRGSASGAPRSPSGDQQQFPPSRPMSIMTTGDGQSYPPQYPVDAAGPPMTGYPPPDAHINSNINTHTIPIHPHEQAGHPMAPNYGDGYTQSPVTAGPPYGGLPFGHPLTQQGGRPKKGNRATQACDVCRLRKAKCDEGRPRCGFCVENDSQCNYQSVAPAKVDRANQVVLDQIQAQQRDIEMLKEKFGNFGDQLERIEKLVSSQQPVNVKQNAVVLEATETKPLLKRQNSPKQAHPSSHKSIPSAAQQNPSSKDVKVVDASPNASFNAALSESPANENLPSVAKQNAIHTEHNTAAQKLFRWPSIKALLQRCKKLHFTESSENYVFDMELHKGPLHLYGKGQGPDDYDHKYLSGSATSPANSSTSIPSDEASDTSSPASSVDLVWGHGFNPCVGDSAKDSLPGGLCPENTLKLDSRTIKSLHQSYMQNIHIMHPFLDEAALAKTIERFKKRHGISSDLGSSKAAYAAPVSNVNLDALRDPGNFNKPVKRKHSDGQYWSETSLLQAPGSSGSPLERSPATAVVLLVMALGKICERREKLPGPVAQSSREHFNNMPRSYVDSPPLFPMRPSPSSSSFSTVQSPVNLARQAHLSPRSSIGGQSPPERNLDVIPGLAYYAQATDILGNLAGSHDIIYVQCCLLAGLYAGQLANSVESLHWIQSASRGCCILARDSTLRNHPKPRQNQIRLAFYTALQLESDILAEIDFPPSGIRRIENVPYPDGYFPEDTPLADGASSHKSVVMQFYSYQLHLRNLLDCIQQNVYPPGKELTESAKNGSQRAIFHDWLESWRTSLPPEFKWNDGDHESRDINQARLRGKYFGALYIIHRPMVHYALELEATGELDRYLAQCEEQGYGSMGPPKAPINPFIQDVLNSAKLAISAAVQSTSAFDEAMAMRRLIVTNIFGTAHAQFGNMLVLSAVYKSRALSGYIDADPRSKLKHLFSRTIGFLGQLRLISPTLGHDQFILQRLEDVVFEDEEEMMSHSTASSSFD